MGLTAEEFRFVIERLSGALAEVETAIESMSAVMFYVSDSLETIDPVIEEDED